MTKQMPPDRIYIPSKPTIIEGFRILREWFEKHAAARGEKLDPAWYDDGPETCPWLWKDQPEVLKQASPEGDAR